MLLETAVADYRLQQSGRGELLGGIADALWQLERPDRARPHLDA